MKPIRSIVWLALLLSLAACGRTPQHASPEDLQEAQTHYDSGFVCLQHDSLLPAIPYFIRAAEKLEYLPEDMTDEEMLLASQAYYQMAHVFGIKMESGAEIDALRWALGYQRRIDDTAWMVRSSLALALAFENLMEYDSAWVYLDRVMPLVDTVSDDAADYISARNLLAFLYLDGEQLDSCLQVQRDLIAFKTRRGMDVKGDSVGMGMNLFFSGHHAEAKPYLRKVFEADFGDVERGAIITLLAQVYEEEQHVDSAAYCHSFSYTYAEAEAERVTDGMLAVKQYDNYKALRDARLTALREQRQAQKAKALRWVCVVVALLLVAAAVFVVYHRRYKRRVAEQHQAISRDLQEARGTLETQALETLRLKAESIYNDRFNNKVKRIREVFDEAYPEAMPKLKAAYPDLSDTELDLCVLSFFPFRMKEIADLLHLRENTVSKYRTAIKKKTQMETFEGLWERFIG